MTESRTRRRIRKALEAKGYTITWEPIGAGGEKTGASGGWYVYIESTHNPTYHNILAGLNVGDVLWWIERLPHADPLEQRWIDDVWLIDERGQG